MKLLYAICFAFFITSCATRLHYIGNSFPASERVDLYVEQSSIQKPYNIIGKGFVEAGTFTSNYIKRIQLLAIAKAKQKGADAVLIKDFYVPAAALDLQTTSRTDSVGRGTITAGTTSVQQSGEQKFTVLFLKHTN